MPPRIHFSIDPIAEIRSVPQPNALRHKPQGFWYAFGLDWKRWGRAESFTIGQLPYFVFLRRGIFTDDIARPHPQKVLQIKTVSALHRFNDKYYIEPRGDWIDWARVANDYAGIEFWLNPAKRRMIPMNRFVADYNWFDSLDIPSGCIWRTGIIERLQPIEGSPRSTSHAKRLAAAART